MVGRGVVLAALPLLFLLLRFSELQPSTARTALFPSNVYAAESEYRRCETGTASCQIGEFLYDDDYAPVPPANAACTLAVRDPSGTLLNDPPGYYTTSETADGWYSYNFDTTGQVNGLYRSTMCCTVTTPSQTLCLDKSFIIGPSVEDAVLDADLTDHTTAGTFGWYFQNPLGLVKDIWEYTTRSLNDFTDLVAAIWDNTVTRSLTTRSIAPGENIAQEETVEKQWTARFSGDGEVLVSKAYRAKLWILNTQTELADAVSNPSVTIYDANRAIPVSAPTVMTKVPATTGIYELVWTVPTGSVAGRWETVVNINIGGAASIQDGSYWEVETDSPAQVKINSITDNTVESITANVTIKNEGGNWYEYKYAYCVVSNQSNQCGGGDDTFYAQDSKKLLAGESWTTDLDAIVPNPGTYYFKLIVYWGTERSAAVRQFTATSGAVCLGDLNSDGWVDLTDFSILLFYWNTSNPIADLNDDGIVNLTDFSIMLFHWGACP